MRRRILLFPALIGLLLLAACAPRPFDGSSPWNTPISAGVGWRDEPGLRAGRSWVNDEQFSIPLVRSAPSDPVVSVRVPSTWGWPAGVTQVRVPADVTGAAGSDGALTVVDGGTVYDFWQFQRLDLGHARASAWAATFLSGPGVGRASPFLGAGIRAAGTSGFGGLITGADMTGPGDFRHALAVSLLGSLLNGAHVAPAIAGESGSGSIPTGARLGIPRGTPMPAGLSPIGQRTWNTLMTYGAIVVDRHSGSAPVIFYADPRSVSPATVAPLRSGDLDRIMPAVRVVQ
jgi:hypothetical protein